MGWREEGRIIRAATAVFQEKKGWVVWYARDAEKPGPVTQRTATPAGNTPSFPLVILSSVHLERKFSLQRAKYRRIQSVSQPNEDSSQPATGILLAQPCKTLQLLARALGPAVRWDSLLFHGFRCLSLPFHGCLSCAFQLSVPSLRSLVDSQCCSASTISIWTIYLPT